MKPLLINAHVLSYVSNMCYVLPNDRYFRLINPKGVLTDIWNNIAQEIFREYIK
jgi:hypothetical protein